MISWGWLLAVAGIAGLLIGTVGVGGILLIPALAAFAHLPIQVAMATALCSFVLPSVVGIHQYQKRGSINWPITLPICLGALFSGYAGAVFNASSSASWLSLLLDVLILLSGCYSLFANRQTAAQAPERQSMSRPALVLIGITVGFLSGLTGAGGPVISVPLMVTLGFAPLTTIATSQVLQIVAAVSGTAGNILHGHIDFRIALWAAVMEVVGIYAGAYLAHRANVRQLRLLVGCLCILAGGGLMVRTLATF